MEIKGKVKARYEKNGKYGVIIDGIEGWFSGFGDCPVQKGDQVTMEYEVNGDFKNIKKLETETQGTVNAPIEKPMEKAIEVKPEEPKVGQSIWDKKDKYVRASMCVSYAKDLVVAGKIEMSKLRQEAMGLLDLIEELAMR